MREPSLRPERSASANSATPATYAPIVPKRIELSSACKRAQLCRIVFLRADFAFGAGRLATIGNEVFRANLNEVYAEAKPLED